MIEPRSIPPREVQPRVGAYEGPRESGNETFLGRFRPARDIVYLLRRRLRSENPQSRAEAGLGLLERFAAWAAPGYVVSEGSKTWWTDRDFLDRCRTLGSLADRAAERKFLLRELLAAVEHVPGDTAEAGVYQGASSWFICDHFAGSERTHWAFDSFQGLSRPVEADGAYWSTGDLKTGEELVRHILAPYPVEIRRGWIPESFGDVAAQCFCFVHIDVDLYEPTRASLEFFYPRLSSGGIVVCDDYGFTTCPGAKRAFDEFVRDKPEPVIHLPTGQGMLVKR
jgi:O-methyltransferase